MIITKRVVNLDWIQLYITWFLAVGVGTGSCVKLGSELLNRLAPRSSQSKRLISWISLKWLYIKWLLTLMYVTGLSSRFLCNAPSCCVSRTSVTFSIKPVSPRPPAQLMQPEGCAGIKSPVLSAASRTRLLIYYMEKTQIRRVEELEALHEQLTGWCIARLCSLDTDCPSWQRKKASQRW